MRLEVSDTGQGIEASFLPHVFERFRQADSGTRRKQSGLGLGLSIVKYLVELHGGTVEAQSAGAGLGATFIVHLPIKALLVDEDETVSTPGEVDDGDDHYTAPTESGPPPVRLDGLRLLVVDDEADARRMLTKVLEGVGALVTVVGSAPTLWTHSQP